MILNARPHACSMSHEHELLLYYITYERVHHEIIRASFFYVSFWQRKHALTHSQVQRIHKYAHLMNLRVLT